VSPVVATVTANAPLTFDIFVAGASMVRFGAAKNRIPFRFTDAGGVPRGSMGVTA
jgi:hypothetical protein